MRSNVHFEGVFFFRLVVVIILLISLAEHVSVVFLSCWAKRRLSMAWRFNQLDANRHNRFNRGITFHGGGRFMHRCQSTCGQVVRFRKDSVVFLSRFECFLVVHITETRENAGISEFLCFLVEMFFLSF